jgi:dipeptidyl aminopeptidase/acylaminoacyl peptidase
MERDSTTRFTADPLFESVPAWSAGGQSLMFAVGSGPGEIWAKPVNGTVGRRLLASEASADFYVNPLLTTMSATSDGRFLVFTAETRGTTRSDLWILPLTPNGTPTALVQQEFDQRYGSISPDSRWLAYVSTETGVDEVFVRPLTRDPAAEHLTVGPAARISREGGTAPRWRGDSQELFYQSPAGGIMAARVSAARIERPVELFRAPGMLPHWGVAGDGRRFLMALPVSQEAPTPFTVVLNWMTGLEH